VRELALDPRRERGNALEGAAADLLARHGDAELPLDCDDELQRVDRVEAQLAAEEGLVVADRTGLQPLELEALDEEPLEPRREPGRR